MISEEILMNNGRAGDAHTLGLAKQAESGVPVSELHLEYKMRIARFQNDAPRSAEWSPCVVSQICWCA
jgi:hypothetical protein